MTQYLKIAGAADLLETLAITSTDEARAQRDELLAVAGQVTEVTTPEEALTATETMRDLKQFAGMVEAARTTIKAPVLEVAKRIDATAKDLVARTLEEYDRVGRILGSWQQEQRKKEDEARRRAWEDEQRIRREAEAQQRAAKTEAEAERIEVATVQAVAETRAAVAEVRAVSPAGTTVRRTPCFEVTDVYALYESNPALVVLSPNKAAINALLRTLPDGKHIPGIRHWFEVKAGVR